MEALNSIGRFGIGAGKPFNFKFTHSRALYVFRCPDGSEPFDTLTTYQLPVLLYGCIYWGQITRNIFSYTDQANLHTGRKVVRIHWNIEIQKSTSSLKGVVGNNDNECFNFSPNE